MKDTNEEWKERFKKAYLDGKLTGICGTCNDYCDSVDIKGVKTFISNELDTQRQAIYKEVIAFAEYKKQKLSGLSQITSKSYDEFIVWLRNKINE